MTIDAPEVYGSSRLCISYDGRLLAAQGYDNLSHDSQGYLNKDTSSSLSILPQSATLGLAFTREKKRYELTEHRGNVMVTLSDRRAYTFSTDGLGNLRRKKHGIKMQPADAVLWADKTNRPIGKWGSMADLNYAGEQAARLISDGGFMDFPIRPGSTSKVHYKDGTTSTPDMIRLRNNGDGTFHGFPIDSKTAEPITKLGTLRE
ncbi:MAG: hypothetical protein AAFP89_25690 [Bacteroidota bacterium]